MLCMISPALEAFAESVSTLKFANRAKKIKNDAVVNEDLDQRALLRKYERELKLLRSELKQRNADLVDKRRLLEVCGSNGEDIWLFLFTGGGRKASSRA